jgi:hypothetical protein
MVLLIVEIEEEQQVHHKIIGLGHLVIQEGLVLEQNRLFYIVIRLIEKLLEIMGQLLKIGLFLHLHDSIYINILFIQINSLQIIKIY